MANKKIPCHCLLCTKVITHPVPETRSKYDLQSQSPACKTKLKKLPKRKKEELLDQNNIDNFSAHVRKFCELFKLESTDEFTSELTEFLISSTLSSTCPLCKVCQSRMELIAEIMTYIQNLQAELIRVKIAVESDLKLNDTRSFKTPLTASAKGSCVIDIGTKTRFFRKCLQQKLQLDLNAEVPVVANVDVTPDDGNAANLITITILPSVLSVHGSEQTIVQFDGVDGVDIDVNEDLEKFNLVKDEAEDEIKIETDVDIEIENTQNTPAELLNDIAACINHNGDATTPRYLVETEFAAIDNDGIYVEETIEAENVSIIIEMPEEVEVALADHDYSLSLSLSDIGPHPPTTKQAKNSEPPNVEIAPKVFRKYNISRPTNKPETTCAKKRKRPQAQDKAVKKYKRCGKVLQCTVVKLVKGQCISPFVDQLTPDPHHTQPHERLSLSLNDASAIIDIQGEAQIEPLVSACTPQGIHYNPDTERIRFADMEVETRYELTTDDLDDNFDNENLDLKLESDPGADLDESNIEDLSRHELRKPLPLRCTFVDPVKGECKRRVRDQDRLDAHVNRVHKKLTSSKAFQCNECSFTSDSLKRLNVHRKLHVGTKDVTCEICGMSFLVGEYLVKHKRRMHGEPFPFHCDACKVGFNYSHDLKLHNYKNHGDGNYTHRCSVCGAGFYVKLHLDTHMVKHAEPTFQCDECPKKFRDKGKLKQHKITHTGIRPFVCDVCDWSFFTNGKLRKHYSIHTKKRPYLCQECGFSCRLRQLLTVHLKVHENNKSLAEKGIKKQPRLAKPRNRRIKTYENIFPPSAPTLAGNASAETETSEQVGSQISKDGKCNETSDIPI